MNELLTSIGYTLFWFLIFAGIIGMFLLLIWISDRVQGKHTAAERRKHTQHEQPAPEEQRQPILHRPTPAPSAAQAPPRLLVRQWLDLVNTQPDRNPHMIVTGPTGSGKTTVVLAALHDRPGRIVIVTPKSKKADPWGGFPVIRLRRHDMSYEPMITAIEAVHAEMIRRNAQDADVDGDWLTLVIDEYPDIIAEQKSIAVTVLKMLRLARSSRIRIILLATETSVKALGLEGNGAARQNCIFIEMDENRNGALYRWEKPPTPIDTSAILTYARQTFSSDRCWYTPPVAEPEKPAPMPDVRRDRPLQVSKISADDLDIPRRPSPFHRPENALEKIPPQETDFPLLESDFTISELAFSPEEIAQIGALIASGKGKTEVVKVMPRYSGRKHSLYIAYYDRLLAAVNQVLDPIETT